MIGGRVIEIVKVLGHASGAPVVVDGPIDPGDVVRIWVIDPLSRRADELCVYALAAVDMPILGDAVWWQTSFIYFAKDTKRLIKIGFSFRPPQRKLTRTR